MNQKPVQKKYFSTTEAAGLLHVSRTTVFKKIKSGEIKAEKVGRNFIIPYESLSFIFEENLDEKTKEKITKSVDRVIQDHGETIKRLGDE